MDSPYDISVTLDPVVNLIKGISDKVDFKNIPNFQVADPAPQMGLSIFGDTVKRNDLVAKLIANCIGLGVSLTITYFGMKYLMKALDPTNEEKRQAEKQAQELLQKIGISSVKLSNYEMCIASNLVDPLSMVTSWDDIGGLDSTIQDIKETVILPFSRSELFSNSSLIESPKGVLLHGPPGCGKTMIAKAMAKSAGARFINLQISSLVDKWYGESQKRAEAVFSLATKLQPTIIFIDEIDSFLRARSSSDHEATNMIKTQFMCFWDGLMTKKHAKIMIVGATNRPADVDAAIRRRMPCMFYIGLPPKSQRLQILKLILADEEVSDTFDYPQLASLTENLSGSDLKELCRQAAFYRVRDFLKDENAFHDADDEVDTCKEDTYKLRPFIMSDFVQALEKFKQSKDHISSTLSFLNVE